MCIVHMKRHAISASNCWHEGLYSACCLHRMYEKKMDFLEISWFIWYYLCNLSLKIAFQKIFDGEMFVITSQTTSLQIFCESILYFGVISKIDKEADEQFEEDLPQGMIGLRVASRWASWTVPSIKLYICVYLYIPDRMHHASWPPVHVRAYVHVCTHTCAYIYVHVWVVSCSYCLPVYIL